MSKSKSTATRTLNRYWQVTASQLGMFMLSVVTTLGFVFFLSYVNPYVMAQVVDRVAAEPVLADQVFAVFGPSIAMLIAANVVGQISSKLQDYTVWKLEIRANYALATQAFDTLSNQSMTFHSNRFGGSLVSQTQKFISGYTTLLECLIYAIIPIIATAVFTIVMLWSAVPLFVAILVGILIVYTLVTYIMYKRILPLNAGAASAQNSLSGELSDSITNIMAVKTYGKESYERQIFDAANHDVLQADSKRMRASTVRGAVTSSILVLIMVLLVIFVTGGNAWFGISAGTLVMMFSYTYALTMQFNRIALTFQAVNRGLGDAHDMTQILDEPRLVDDVSEAADLVVQSGAISFNSIDFAYNDKSAVFQDFKLDIPAGQKLGLVGRSGSGKTTLTTLLLRLSNLQGGAITIDGQNIAQVSQVSLRRNIAYVPQEPMLFHRSIRDNISYGSTSAKDVTDEKIRDAASKANALEFIESLPQGFDTITGERGIKLSGGQRQRIAIARAIYADAPILVLDEATSSLDSQSEKAIQDALQTLMRGRTCIVVAHRLSTVASLDRIVVLSHGQIIEDGTHTELLNGNGEYAKLWNRQTGLIEM